MKSFSEYFSFSDFIQVMSYDERHPSTGLVGDDLSKWHSEWFHYWRRTRSTPIQEFLKQAFSDGLFGLIRNDCERDTTISSLWKACFSGDTSLKILRGFERILRMEMTLVCHKTGVNEDSYRCIMGVMDSGSYPWHSLELSSSCQRTGENFRYLI